MIIDVYRNIGCYSVMKIDHYDVDLDGFSSEDHLRQYLSTSNNFRPFLFWDYADPEAASKHWARLDRRPNQWRNEE